MGFATVTWEWQAEGFRVCRSSLKRNPPSPRGWAVVRKASCQHSGSQAGIQGGSLVRVGAFNLYFWNPSSVSKSSCEGKHLGFLYINFQTKWQPRLRDNRGLRARVPTFPFHLKVSISRGAIIKNRGIHQKKPLNIAMKSLWKQKKANKGMSTGSGSQEPHCVAINNTPKFLEVTCLFI